MTIADWLLGLGAAWTLWGFAAFLLSFAVLNEETLEHTPRLNAFLALSPIFFAVAALIYWVSTFFRKKKNEA